MLPFFISLTHGMARGQKGRLIRNSTATALLVSISFLFVGKLVLLWLGITISDFLVAGGAILFILSIRDLTSYGKAAKIPDETTGVVPLAVPLIVGPAVLTTSLVLLNSFGIFPTLSSIVFNILLCGLILYYASGLSKVLGKAGSHMLSKISSLFLAAIGVMLIRRGAQEIIAVWFSK